MYKLFIDDLANTVRSPEKTVENREWRIQQGLSSNIPNLLHLGQWKIALNFNSAVQIILKFGIPNFISFDHDLGEDKNAYDIAKYIVDLDLDNKLTFPDDFNFEVHSSNPIGKKNIETYLTNYINFKNGYRATLSY